MTQTFSDLLVSTLPAMRAYSMLLTRNRSAADDLVRDAAERILGRAEQFQTGTNFKAWAFTILRHRHIDGIRRAKRANLTDLGAEPDSVLPPTPPNQEDRLVLKELLSSIDDLASEQREVLLLIVAQGMAYEEAANVVGCPVGTIRSRLSRARRALEAAMMGEKPQSARAREPRTARVRSIGSAVELAA